MNRSTSNRSLVLLGIAMFAITHLASAFDTDLPFLDARVRTVVAFKDGTSFVVYEGKVKVGEGGWVTTRPITAAAFGTVGAVCATDGAHIRMLTTTAPAKQGQKGSFAEAVALADGRPITLRRRHSEAAITGTFLSIRQPAGLAAPIGFEVAQNDQDLVMAIKSEQGILTLIPMAEVMEFSFLDGEQIRRDPEGTGQQLKIQVGNVKPGQEVVLRYFYLDRGFRWTPSYMAERTDDGKVKVSLRGELQNDLIDLRNTELFLAVGVPSFAYLNNPSPLVARKSIQQVTTALNLQIPHLNMSNGVQFANIQSAAAPLSTQLVEEVRGHAGNVTLPDVGSTDAGNLHLFKMQDVTIRKGERGLLFLAELILPCSDLVEWHIPDNAVNAGGLVDNSLKHYWRIQAGQVPLSSGPFLTAKNGLALSQARIYYTPRGGTGNVYAGPAIGVQSQVHERIIKRVEGRKQVNDRQERHQDRTVWMQKEIRWEDVTKEFVVTIRNDQPFAADFVITRSLLGVAVADQEGVRVETMRARSGYNEGQLQASWAANLKPGQSQTFKLRYLTRIYTKR